MKKVKKLTRADIENARGTQQDFTLKAGGPCANGGLRAVPVRKRKASESEVKGLPKKYVALYSYCR